MLVITVCTTPNFFTLVGGEIYIGVVNPMVAISISSSVADPIDLLLKLIVSRLTTLKLVQST